MSHRLLLGVLQWLGSSFGADLPENTSSHGGNCTHEGCCIVPRAKGYKHDWFKYNWETRQRCCKHWNYTNRYHSKPHLQILNIVLSSPATPPTQQLEAGLAHCCFSCVGALNTPCSSCSWQRRFPHGYLSKNRCNKLTEGKAMLLRTEHYVELTSSLTSKIISRCKSVSAHAQFIHWPVLAGVRKCK